MGLAVSAGLTVKFARPPFRIGQAIAEQRKIHMLAITGRVTFLHALYIRALPSAGTISEMQ